MPSIAAQADRQVGRWVPNDSDLVGLVGKASIHMVSEMGKSNSINIAARVVSHNEIP